MQLRRTPHQIFALALCLGSILGLLLASPPVEAQTSSQTVYGTIVDETGAPLQKATIRIKSLVGSPIALKSQTNKKGKYRLVLPTFKWDFDITVEKEGYHTYFETVDFQMLRNGERSVVRDFTLFTMEGAARRALEQAQSGQVMTGIQKEAVTAFNQGVRQYNGGELEAAKTDLEAALEADPAIAPARRLLALTYLRLKNYTDAVTAAQAIIDLVPEDREMWQVLRDSFQETGDEEGLKRAQDALTALP